MATAFIIIIIMENSSGWDFKAPNGEVRKLRAQRDRPLAARIAGRILGRGWGEARDFLREKMVEYGRLVCDIPLGRLYMVSGGVITRVMQIDGDRARSARAERPCAPSLSQPFMNVSSLERRSRRSGWPMRWPRRHCSAGDEEPPPVGVWPLVQFRAATRNAATIACAAGGSVHSLTPLAQRKFDEVRRLCSQHDVISCRRRTGVHQTSAIGRLRSACTPSLAPSWTARAAR